MANRHHTHKGIRIRMIALVGLLIASINTIALLYTSQMVYQSADKLQKSTEDYINCQKNASEFLSASDYLTSCARSFVVTTDISEAEHYFNEINVNKRRETAQEQLMLISSEAELKKMIIAAKFSDDLEMRELYAIKMVCLAREYDMDALSESLQYVRLNAADSSLSPVYMLIRARDMLYSTTYQQMKDYINSNVSEYLSELLTGTQTKQMANMEQFKHLQTLQAILTAVLTVMPLLFFASVFFWLILPLLNGVQSIRKQTLISVQGAQEFRLFASRYNALLESNRIRQEELMYKASHDALTGVNNREMFEKYYQGTLSSENMALLLIDIDYFKQINDTYGHQVGDRILVKTATLLQSSFRAGDCICRIGGDEFVVILLNADLIDHTLLRDKFKRISGCMSQPAEPDLPAVTLSIGVSFGKKDIPIKQLYEQADQALYTVKNHERSNIAFYDELTHLEEKL